MFYCKFKIRYNGIFVKDRPKEEKLTNDVKVAAPTTPPLLDAASRRRRRFGRIGYRWKQQRGRRLPST